MNNASWTKLHAASPTHIAVGDIDGNNQDDAIIDFGSGSGIWIRYNNTSWTQAARRDIADTCDGRP